MKELFQNTEINNDIISKNSEVIHIKSKEIYNKTKLLL